MNKQYETYLCSAIYKRDFSSHHPRAIGVAATDYVSTKQISTPGLSLCMNISLNLSNEIARKEWSTSGRETKSWVISATRCSCDM